MQDLARRRSEQGISLLEISIALIVVGILIVPILQMYNINKMERQSRENNKSLENIAIALNKYAQQHKKYPVPSDPTLAASNASYGTPGLVTATSNCASITGVRCINGASPNTADIDEVLIGTVPFRELGLDEKEIYDIYGSKITYYITRQLTDPNTFRNGAGAIRIADQDNQPLVIKLTRQNGSVLNDPSSDSELSEPDTINASNENRVMFAIVSHGADRKGAWQRDGTISACTNAGLDANNCNSASMTSTLRGRYKSETVTIEDPASPGTNIQAILQSPSRSFSNASGATHYDDTLVYRTTSRDKGWTGLRSENATDEEGAYLSEAGKIAIKADITTPVTPNAAMDVGGNVQAFKTMAQTVCNESAGTTNCFRLKNILAPEPTDPVEMAKGGLDKSVKCDSENGLTGFDLQTDSSVRNNTHTPNQSERFIKRNCPSTKVPSGNTNQGCPNGISRIVGGFVQCR